MFLVGIPWQYPVAVLGLLGSSHHYAAPLILLGAIPHSVLWAVPLNVMGLVSGVRWRVVYKGNLRDSAFTFGLECLTPGCLWATPICAEPEQARLRADIHTHATGHRKYDELVTRACHLIEAI